MVRVSPDTGFPDADFTNTISSLDVSGLMARVNWSLAARVSGTKVEPVPLATVIVVAEVDIPVARVVSIEVELNFLVIIYPYRL
jgi:hypothetical protein